MKDVFCGECRYFCCWDCDYPDNIEIEKNYKKKYKNWKQNPEKLNANNDCPNFKKKRFWQYLI